MAFFDDPFLMFILFILVTAIFAPFGIFGMYRFYQWFTGWFKVRSGHIRVRQRMPNGRWNIFWSKPSGSKIKLKDDESGKNQDIPVKLDGEMIGFEGSTPFIEIDENLQQMPLKRTVLTIPKEHSTRMAYLAYLAGKIAGMREENIMQWLLIAAICAMIGIGVFMWWTTNGVKNQVTELSAKISSLPILNQTQGQSYSPPQVG